MESSVKQSCEAMESSVGSVKQCLAVFAVWGNEGWAVWGSAKECNATLAAADHIRKY